MIWHSLFLPSTNTEHVLDALRQTLRSQGLSLYDPFAGLTAQGYAVAWRGFVAAPASGWTRIIVDPTTPITITSVFSRHIADVSRHSGEMVCVEITLSEAEAQLTAWLGGEEAVAPDALAAYLRPGLSPADLQGALTASSAGPAPQPQRANAPIVPLEVLPPEIQQMARRTNARQINTLFNRVLRQIGSPASAASDTTAARALLKLATANWDSPAGRRLHAAVNCLTFPPGWESPDFVPLRDAYQLHLRRQRRPDAPLYPGDAEAMAHVADALTYHPVYAGK